MIAKRDKSGVRDEEMPSERIRDAGMLRQKGNDILRDAAKREQKRVLAI